MSKTINGEYIPAYAKKLARQWMRNNNEARSFENWKAYKMIKRLNNERNIKG